jgi:hypothetical protein
MRSSDHQRAILAAGMKVSDRQRAILVAALMGHVKIDISAIRRRGWRYVLGDEDVHDVVCMLVNTRLLNHFASDDTEKKYLWSPKFKPGDLYHTIEG